MSKKPINKYIERYFSFRFLTPYDVRPIFSKAFSVFHLTSSEYYDIELSVIKDIKRKFGFSVIQNIRKYYFVHRKEARETFNQIFKDFINSNK